MTMTLLLTMCIFVAAHLRGVDASDVDPKYTKLELPHGILMPRIGLGTAGFAGQSSKMSQIVKIALDSGVRLLDTAQAKEWYDEAGVGRGITNYHQHSSQRNESHAIDELVIVTKIHPRSFRLDKMNRAVDNSRKLLLTAFNDPEKPLDVILLHAPNCWQGQCTKEEEAITWHTGWRNLEKMEESGKVLAIGVSNFHPHQLRELLERVANSRVSVIQNWMDPFNQDREVREIARQNGIVYMAYSSFGTQWEWKLHHNPVFQCRELREIADKHDTTIAQVVLSWVVQEGAVAIPRGSSEDHVRANAALISRPSADNSTGESSIHCFLDDDDMAKIRSLDGSLGPLWD